MPSSRRLDRVNQLLLEEIATIVQRDLRDPGLGFVTVVSVKTTNDLKTAFVYVSFLGSDEQKADGLAALNRAAPWVRGKVMPHVQIKTMPRLEFVLDETAEKAARISALLHGSAAPPDGEGEE